MTEIKLSKDGTPDRRYKQGGKRVKKDGSPWGQRQPRSTDDMGKKKKSVGEVLDSMGIKPKEEKVAKQEDKQPEQANKQAALTTEERALADRIANEDSWTGITEESMVDFSLDSDPYPLPLEAKKRQDAKELAFKWVLRDVRRIDEVCNQEPPMKWWVCNSTRTPFLAPLCDSIHGGVQNKDQILVVKPYWMHRKHKDAELALAEAKGMAGAIEAKDGEKHDWGEYRSGEDQKISGPDQVAHYNINESTGDVEIKGFSSEEAA